MAKKMNEMWDNILEYFEEHYVPRLGYDVVDWYPSGHREITVKLSNGRVYIYNWVTHNLAVVFKSNDETYVDYDEDELKKKFKYTLARKMDDMWINSTELSNMTGISEVTISKYLNGRVLPNYINLRKLAQAFKCSISEFYIYK